MADAADVQGTDQSAQQLLHAIAPRHICVIPEFPGEREMVVKRRVKQSTKNRRGVVFVEYLLLLTIVGLGAIVGLACIRQALFDELVQLAAAITAITP